MSTNLRDFNRTISPGDLVISLADIFDRLEGTVDENTLRQLLSDIISGRRNQVRPGELITAELINQILAQLESLELRVTALEAGGSTTSPVVITRLEPPETQSIRVGQELTVHGRNFGFSTQRHEAFVDNFRVLTFKDGSSNTRLIFDIPLQIPDPPTAGRPATLTVSNQQTQDQRAIRLLPREPVIQGSNVDVLFDSLDPTTIRSSVPVTFRLSVRSEANMAQTITIRPTISNVANSNAWQDQIQVLNDDLTPNTSRSIPLPAGARVFFNIRIPIVPTVPDETTFRLTVDALFATGGISGSFARTFTVAELTPEEDMAAIPTLTFSRADPSTAVQGSTIQMRTGVPEVIVTLTAEFAIAPATYDVLSPVVTGAGWNVVRFAGDTPPFFEIVPGDLTGDPPRVTRLPSYVATSNSTASASGEVTFVIQRRGQALRRTFSMGLARV